MNNFVTRRTHRTIAIVVTALVLVTLTNKMRVVDACLPEPELIAASSPAVQNDTCDIHFNHLHKFHTKEPIDLREHIELLEGATTYNRAMVWLDEDDGVRDGIIAYSGRGELSLTGHSAVASWNASEQRLISPNRVDTIGETQNRLVRVKGQDHAIAHMRDFEFLPDQHPTLSVDVKDVTGEWEFEVAMRHQRNLEGRTFYRSGRRSGSASLQIDLKKILRNRGYTTTAIRLDFFIYLYGETGSEGSMLFSVRLNPSVAIVPQLPIFRTREQALSGIPLHAIVVDEHGQRMHAKNARLIANVNGKNILLTEKGHTGVFSSLIKKLQVGEFPVSLEASVGDSLLTASTFIMINDGRFVHFDSIRRRYCRGDENLGYLTGNTVWTMNMPYGVNSDGERVPIHGAAEYNQKTRANIGVAIGVPWQAMTPAEIAEWIDYYAGCGMRAVKLASWPPVTIDAVGAICPYGAEIIAIILRELESHGMYAVTEVLHDEPGRLAWPEHVIGTWTQYTERGYPFGTKESLEMVNYDNHQYTSQLRDAWCSPDVMGTVKELYRHFSILFGDATTIMALIMDGEGDGELGPRYVNQMYDVVRERDQNHVINVDRSTHLSRDRTPFFDCNWTEPYVPRHFLISGAIQSYKDFPVDIFSAVQARFFSLNRAGVDGEGDCFSYPYPTSEASTGWAPKSKYGMPWVMTEEYKLLVRDGLWMGMVEGLPFYYNWNSILHENEYLFPTLVSDAIDWNSFVPEVPSLFLRVHALILDKDIFKLVRYEKSFTRLGILPGYVWDEESLPTGDRWLKPNPQQPPFVVIDAARAYVEPKRKSEGGEIADIIFDLRPIVISSGYSVNYLLNQERDVMVAYVRNTTNYSGVYRVNREAVDLQVALQKLHETKLFLAVIDLDKKKVMERKEFTGQTEIELGKTNHDFCVFVSPRPISFPEDGYIYSEHQ